MTRKNATMSQVPMDLRDFFQKGSASDLLWAQMYYFIYRTIGENASEINRKEKSYKQMNLTFLQITSHDMALLRLSRFYDRKKKNYTVRCLEAVIEECKRVDSNHFPIFVEYYPYLTQLAAISEVRLTDEALASKDLLIEFFTAVRNSKKVEGAIGNLFYVRDKYVAHNENLVIESEIPTFWDDYAFLLRVGRLFQSAIGQIFLDVSYSIDSDPISDIVNWKIPIDMHWIVEYIEEYVGREKFINWVNGGY